MALKACAFDLGNTLVNDLALQQGTIERTGRWLQTHGIVPSADEFTGIYQRHNSEAEGAFFSRTYGERVVFERSFDELGLGPEQAEVAMSAYRRFLMDAVERDADVVAALEILRANGVRTAIISNERIARVRAYLDKTGLEPLFDVIVVSEGVGAEKPDLAIFRVAMETLSLPGEAIAMFGDNPMADGACKEVGMTYVEVTAYRDARWFWEQGNRYEPDITIDRVSPENVRHVLNVLAAGV